MSHEGRMENRAVYVAVGIDLEGRKDVLGLSTSANEAAKFWLQVLTELRNRGVKDIFIACVDGLKGFAQAIKTMFPQAQDSWEPWGCCSGGTWAGQLWGSGCRFCLIQ